MQYYGPALNNGQNIFVFGSNLAGRHGKGAAKEARLHWGAKSGMWRGLHGRSYAIPTKDARLMSLPLEDIAHYVNTFLRYARANMDTTFLCTRIGCGLAGFTDDQIAPLFRCASVNVMLPDEW